MSQTLTQITPKTDVLVLQNGSRYEPESNQSSILDEIPTIDAARIWSEEIADRKAVAEEIRKAAHDIGYFYLVNHGVDISLAENAFDQAKKFFALPEGRKMEVFTGKVKGDYVGFHPMEYYNRNQWKQRDMSEAFNFAYDASFDPESMDPKEPSVSIWPSDLPEFKKGLFDYHAELLKLSRRLTRTFALALHLPEDVFDQYIKRPEAGMRVLHYPAQTRSRDEQQGIGAHTDVECFTIVTQDDAGGLEVLNKKGHWVKARPIPGSFVINIADCFQRQMNDYFVSTVHRVINESGKEGYSAPFFWGFDRSKVLDPVPTCIDAQNPMRYPVMTAGEYWAWRTNKQKSLGQQSVADQQNDV